MTDHEKRGEELAADASAAFRAALDGPKPLMERGGEALVRSLLKQALGELDTIAAEPTPYESDARLVAVYRKLAGDGAKHIRDKLRAAGYRP